MNSLFIYLELYTNGHSAGSLDVVALLSLLFGILIIVCKNPITSALFLICLFLGIAGYLILVGLNFIGLSYLLVYVGAVSILFIFILMLINVRRSELLSDLNHSLGLNLIISSTVYFAIFYIIPFSLVYYKSNIISFSVLSWIPCCARKGAHASDAAEHTHPSHAAQGKEHTHINTFALIGAQVDVIKHLPFILQMFEAGLNKIYFVTTSLWDGYLMATTHITTIGSIMYTSYSIWLILASIILLLAMVGAIVITIKKK